MPDAARIMLETRLLNGFLGTSYTLDEVAEMDSLIVALVGALQDGIYPAQRRR